MDHYSKTYFDNLAKKKGFHSDRQRGMIYCVLRERREMGIGALYNRDV